MEAGRKTQTFTLSERNPASSAGINTSVSARHLRKNDLGGVIFGCKHSTVKECLSKQLFGLPALHFAYVRNIDPGLPLFLFNYSDRTLHGIFESASSGQKNIDPYGWTEDGSERTPFPAQVRICIRAQCKPLSEKQFRPLISDNYYSPVHFWFELDHAQVENLMSLFKSRSLTGSVIPAHGISTRNSLLDVSPSDKWQLPGVVNGSQMNTDTANQKGSSTPSIGWVQANKYESLPWDDSGNDDCESLRKATFCTQEDEDFNQLPSRWDSYDLDCADKDIGSSNAILSLNGGRHTLEDQLCEDAVKKNEDNMLPKLKQMAVDHEHPNMLSDDCSSDVAGPSTIGGVQQDNKHIPSALLDQVEMEYEKVLMMPSNSHCDIVQLREGMEVLKNIVLDQLQKTRALETKLVESNMEIEQLKERVKELESLTLVTESPKESMSTLILDHEGPIYLLGGYNGISWLSTLDSYSPSKDIITSLMPMSFTRSYASTTTLDSNLYIFGGGDGRLWYDTVERYNPHDNKWTLCPHLIRKKGCLAGATFHNKIFAIGGGDGNECFSDVEMLDLALGRWIENPSMLRKRFAPAAAELNGVLYAVGGFDGKDYLKSAERFDPREASWAKLPSMDTKRGCHSLAVLNEKLYALGGYDGTKMVSSVEVFDPRTSIWVRGEPLNHSRGYAAAVVLGDLIYLIGGVKDGESIVDAVECYKEGFGWRVANSRAIGKRCFLSAAIL